ncbi:O-antigen translocase [Pedobacter agri]|uniref:O-antigen translocase n=1 Tax=Pedobacter agri TaxID=454586 RepID=UPI00292FF427|nr:O-antigen translocase [Pedobacter agri]
MKLIKTSILSGMITIIRVGSGFVVGKMIAVFTGPAGVAVIGQFVNFITIVFTFSNGAINSGVIKYAAEHEDDSTWLKQLFSTSLKISVFCSLGVGIIIVCFATYLSEKFFDSLIYVGPLRMLGITSILYSLNSLFISILNGKKEINKFTLVNTIGSIVGLVLTIILVFFFKIEGALYALILSQVVVFFITSVFITKCDWFSWSYFNHKFNKDIGIKLSHFSLMAIVSALTGPVSQIVLRKIIIGKTGIDDAGYWQGIMRISDGYLLLIITSLTTYYLPKLSSLKSDAELRKEILYGYKIVLPTVFVGCIVIYLMRFMLINTLYTSDFVPMEKLFLFQLLGDFFKVAAWMLGYLIVAKAMTKVYVIGEILFSILYVTLSYVFLRSYGIEGVAIGFAVNYFLYFIIILYLFRKLLFPNVKTQ